jgi:hypothetical protein
MKRRYGSLALATPRSFIYTTRCAARAGISRRKKVLTAAKKKEKKKEEEEEEERKTQKQHES